MARIRIGVGAALLVLALFAYTVPTASATTVSAEFAPALPVTIESLATEADPEVACGGSGCLSVWSAPGGVMGARVSSAGALQDALPLQFAAAGSDPAVVFSGSSYF